MKTTATQIRWAKRPLWHRGKVEIGVIDLQPMHSPGPTVKPNSGFMLFHDPLDILGVSKATKAGLRACEIARLDWSMVPDARGEVGSVLTIEDRIAKQRGGLTAHPASPGPPPGSPQTEGEAGWRRPDCSVSKGRAHAAEQRVVNWFVALFENLGNRRLLLPLGAPHLHHWCCTKHQPDRRKPSRRSIARGASVYRYDASVHRRRHE